MTFRSFSSKLGAKNDTGPEPIVCVKSDVLDESEPEVVAKSVPLQEEIASRPIEVESLLLRVL